MIFAYSVERVIKLKEHMLTQIKKKMKMKKKKKKNIKKKKKKKKKLKGMK